MLPLPSYNQETPDLADWLEMNALVGKAGQASLDDLRTALKVAAAGQIQNASPEQRAIHLEGVISSVGGELESRSILARGAYPFKLRSSSLERRYLGQGRRSSTYAFCLILSYIPWNKRKAKGHFPERTFEEISCLVAQRYLGGKSVRFGWPRVSSKLPSGFGQAVDELSKRVGEGDGYDSAEATTVEKDGGLDVVAWRAIDARSGKLLVFGACATGEDWRDKLTELQPIDFCDLYFRRNVSPYPTKAFFTPRIVPSQQWQNYSKRAGLIFDRCRVSAFVPELPSIKLHGDVQEWMRSTLESSGREADR